MPLPGWRLSEDARRDLRGIASYTKRTWGLSQADRYRASLEAAFDRIAAHPEIGRDRDDLKPGIQTLPVERHLVVYRAGTSNVLILRVVHQMMDFTGSDVP